MNARYYQNIEIPGETLRYESKRRKNSKFWNEGKWNNFINPLLPRFCNNKTFIEIGCNAGLFLKMAEDRGFRHVIGIESHPERMKQAELYKKSNGGKYRLICQQVDRNFNFNNLPIAHVVLFANTHYYLTIPNFIKVIDALRTRCEYCIVVAAKAKIRSGFARYDLWSVREYFNEWKELGMITDVETEGDPFPRPGMYGILFKGALEEYNTRELYDESFGKQAKSDKYRQYALASAMDDFYKRVFSNREFDTEEGAYYKYWRKRRSDVTHEWIQRKFGRQAKLGKDIRDNGMLTPIPLRKKGIFDGQHRLTIARRLGYKTILVRPFIKKCPYCGAMLKKL